MHRCDHHCWLLLLATRHGHCPLHHWRLVLVFVAKIATSDPSEGSQAAQAYQDAEDRHRTASPRRVWRPALDRIARESWTSPGEDLTVLSFPEVCAVTSARAKYPQFVDLEPRHRSRPHPARGQRGHRHATQPADDLVHELRVAVTACVRQVPRQTRGCIFPVAMSWISTYCI